MTRFVRLVLLTSICLAGSHGAILQAAEAVLDGDLHHLRIDAPREWSEFPQTPEADHLEIRFKARQNLSEQSLRLRQQDVKQAWRVVLNGNELGRLRRGEDDMVVYLPVPAETLKSGENVLRIEQDLSRRAAPDDVRVGEVILEQRAVDEVLAESGVTVEVVDGDTGRPTPARITVLNSVGALQTFSTRSIDGLAVRPGLAYTLSGRAEFGLPAGEYTVYAGRGFEYSLASTTLRLKLGQTERLTLSIRREVPTAGWVASDTHVHTVTHSGHGDATLGERIVTLAAEGIELPIATDHGVHVDYQQTASELGARRFFTSVVGNEVTTPAGHFNVFPVSEDAVPPNPTSLDWAVTFDRVHRTPGVKAVILNHARDLHGNTRPFGPELFNAAVGENLDGWPIGFNAMEVIHSGATQTDVMRLFRDWMALLNRGRMIVPVGSSDSHDVGRHFVGQGRTYIRLEDRDPGALNVEQAVNSFLQGRVRVSYGLLTEISVNDKYGSGELATTPGDEVKVSVRVLGPHWTAADRITLYANGTPLRETAIDLGSRNDRPRGVIWSGEWNIPKPRHDVHLVAIATGPGIDGLYWKTAKPYQPDSPDWESRVVGCSGAVWLDVDGDGRRTSAYEYARRLFSETEGDPAALVSGLSGFDQAVASQAFHLLQSRIGPGWWNQVQEQLSGDAPTVKVGFEHYLKAWRDNQSARTAP